MPARNKAYKRCKSTLQLLERKVRAWYESSPYWLLNFIFLYDDIFGIKVAFRRDKLRRHSATMPTKCVAPHMLENSEWVIHPHNTLLNCHTRFTQQTLMQPLYVNLFIMLRGYRDSFQIAGAKTATQQIRNRLGAPTRKVSSSDGIAIYEEQERRCFILYRAKTAYRGSKHMIGQDLNDSNKLQQIIDPIMVSIIPVPLTFHGQFDELRSPHRPIMVSKSPVSLPFHGHLTSLRSSRRPKMVIL